MFAQFGVIAHLITRLEPLVGAVNAAAAVSLATASAVIGRVLLGMLLGDADRRLVAAGNFAMQACGVMMLAVGTTVVMLVPGCVLFGLGIGSLLSLPPLIAQTEFAPTEVPRVVALVTAINQAVFAFAPAIFGILREVSGGYTVTFLTAAVVQVLAAVVAIAGRTRVSVGAFARDLKDQVGLARDIRLASPAIRARSELELPHSQIRRGQRPDGLIEPPRVNRPRWSNVDPHQFGCFRVQSNSASPPSVLNRIPSTLTVMWTPNVLQRRSFCSAGVTAGSTSGRATLSIIPRMLPAVPDRKY